MRKILTNSLLGELGIVEDANVYISPWQKIDSFNSYSIQVTFTGTPVANVSLVVSDDPIGNRNVDWKIQSPTNYDYVSGSTIDSSTVPLGPSGKYIITYEILKTSGTWVALYWNNSSGDGVITSINFVGKGSQV